MDVIESRLNDFLCLFLFLYSTYAQQLNACVVSMLTNSGLKTLRFLLIICPFNEKTRTLVTLVAHALYNERHTQLKFGNSFLWLAMTASPLSGWFLGTQLTKTLALFLPSVRPNLLDQSQCSRLMTHHHWRGGQPMTLWLDLWQLLWTLKIRECSNEMLASRTNLSKSAWSSQSSFCCICFQIYSPQTRQDNSEWKLQHDRTYRY